MALKLHELLAVSSAISALPPTVRQATQNSGLGFCLCGRRISGNTRECLSCASAKEPVSQKKSALGAAKEAK